MEETGSSVDVHILTLCCKGGGLYTKPEVPGGGLYTKPEVAGGGYIRNRK